MQLLPLLKIVKKQTYPLLFATVSGAHLYGFPSPDSDYDLRGVHILPVEEVIGLEQLNETLEIAQLDEGLDLDLVTHDVKKFFQMLLKKNGYVLEQLYSPHIVHSTPEFLELKEITKGCITKHHSHHYLGFSETQWKLFEKESPNRVKPLLYVFRVLLTGIHLMRTGKIECDLTILNQEHQLKYIDELIHLKTTTAEQATLGKEKLPFFAQEYQQLRELLEQSFQYSSLPETPSAKAALNDLLIRIRLKSRKAL